MILQRRLKDELDALSPPLRERGFEIVSGSETRGIFSGDGLYELAAPDRRVRLRIIRERNRDFIQFAFRPQPGQDDWYDIWYALALLRGMDLLVPPKLGEKFPHALLVLDEIERWAVSDADDLGRRINAERERVRKESVAEQRRRADRS